MYGTIARAVLLAGLIASGAAWAQETAPAPVGDMVERYAPAAQISGTAIMGLSLAGTLDPSRGQITAFVPAHWQDQIFCARVVSADGRYLAQREYRTPAQWQSRLVALEFPTRSSAQLSHLSSLDIGITLRTGGCETMPRALRVAPAIWNHAQAIGEGGELLVNSFRAQETYLVVKDDGTRRIDCAFLPHERRTAFDASCVLPPDLLAAGRTLEVELNRIRRGQILPSDTFTIDLQ